MDKYAIIVAGGIGTRMGSVLPKQFLLLQKKPVLWHTLTTFLDTFHDLEVVLVLPEDHFKTGEEIIQSIPGKSRIILTEGGITRFHSVRNGLQHVPFNCIVFIHDAVRCLVTPELLKRCYAQTLANGNAIPSIALLDSLRRETSAGSESIDRKKVRAVQTPQTFLSDTIKKAYTQNYEERFTDDATVAENLGEKIHLVEGELTNIKITRPFDLMIAGQVLLERETH